MRAGDNSGRAGRRLIVEWSVLFALIIVLVWLSIRYEVTGRVDRQLHDIAVARLADAPSDDVLIVAIDDRSLAARGQWPWPRSDHAELITKLDDAGARAILLDILFVESTPNDAPLADAVRSAGSVALPYSFAPTPNAGEGVVKLSITDAIGSGAASQGHVALRPDEDGVVRRIDTLFAGDDGLHRHITVALLEDVAGETAAIPQRANIAASFPLRPRGSYTTIPASAVFDESLPDGFVDGRIVLIGATAQGLQDRYVVPAAAGSMMSGVEIQANLIDALRGGDFVVETQPLASVLLSALLIAVLFLLFWFTHPRVTLLGAILLVLLGLLLAIALVPLLGVWWAPGSAIMGMLIAYPLWGWRRLSWVVDYLRGEAGRLRPATIGPDAPTEKVTDVTGREALELRGLTSQLSERLTFIRSVIRAAPGPILLIDDKLRVILANERAEKAFGAIEVGEDYHLFFERRDIAALEDMDEITLNDGSVLRYSSAHIGDPDAVIVQFFDISSIREAERERQQMLEFLTHDMRNPQVAILAMSEPAEPASDPESARERLQRISGHARHTLHLAENFVQLARLHARGPELSIIDLVSVAIEATDRAYDQARAKNLALSCDAPNDVIFVEGDTSLLARMLDNLLSNAVKFTPANGNILLTVSIEFGKAVLTVADDGMGLPEGRLARPFERFGQKDRQAAASAGLGLAFVKEVVDRHGGTIDVASQRDRGTSFTIRLPLSQLPD